MATTEENDPGVGETTTWSISDLAGRTVSGFSSARDRTVEAVAGKKGGSALSLVLWGASLVSGLSLLLNSDGALLEGSVLTVSITLLLLKSMKQA